MKPEITTVLAMLALAAPATPADTLTVGPSLTQYDYLTITAAIAGAASGDEIVIQPGLYPENLLIASKDLTLRNAGGGTVTVYGQGLDKCLKVTGASTDAAVFGITFSNGFSGTAGAGVSIEGGSRCDLTDCVIENNHDTHIGGGLYMSGGGTITNTVIRDNMSDTSGGGIYLAGTLTKSFVGCTIERNTGSNGGGLAYACAGDRADFVACSFIANTAAVRGGAIAVLGTSSLGVVDVQACRFTGNHADGSGGAVWISDQDVFHAVNSVFSNNTAAHAGGAIKNEQLSETVNCTFVGNDVLDAGVGDTFESVRADANTNLLNCIVVNASAGSHAGPGDLQAIYSLIPEAPMGAPDANGNFNADPMLVDIAGGDLHPGPGSPAIDAGDSRGILGVSSYGYISVLDTPLDLDGQTRNLDDPNTANTGVSVWELCIDLGAFEFQPAAAPSCTADLNGDGILNFFDVSTFLTAYSTGCP